MWSVPAKGRVRPGKNRMAHGVVGPVAGLWRYPVKSMQGEELDAVPVSERGFLGDRAYALIDKESGKIGSAKNPRRWPKVLDYRAVFREPPSPDRSSPPVRIDFPDGSGSVSSDSTDVNDRLSRAFNRAVVLSSAAPVAPSLEEYWPDIDGLAHRETVTDEAIALGAPPGTFFDFSAVQPGDDGNTRRPISRVSARSVLLAQVSTQYHCGVRGGRLSGKRLGWPPHFHRGRAYAGSAHPVSEVRHDHAGAK